MDKNGYYRRVRILTAYQVLYTTEQGATALLQLGFTGKTRKAAKILHKIITSQIQLALAVVGAQPH